MNRAIDSAATEKRCVCRVHDRVDLELCNVAAEDVNLPAHINFSWRCVAPATQNWSDEVLESYRKEKSILRYFITPLLSLLTARADQFAKIRRPAAYNESDRAADLAGLAKTR